MIQTWNRKIFDEDTRLKYTTSLLSITVGNHTGTPLIYTESTPKTPTVSLSFVLSLYGKERQCESPIFEWNPRCRILFMWVRLRHERRYEVKKRLIHRFVLPCSLSQNPLYFNDLIYVRWKYILFCNLIRWPLYSGKPNNTLKYTLTLSTNSTTTNS